MEKRKTSIKSSRIVSSRRNARLENHRIRFKLMGLSQNQSTQDIMALSKVTAIQTQRKVGKLRESKVL